MSLVNCYAFGRIGIVRDGPIFYPSGHAALNSHSFSALAFVRGRTFKYGAMTFGKYYIMSAKFLPTARSGRQSHKRLTIISRWAVVVAQFVERSLPIPEVRGLNPVIGKNLFIY